MSEALKIKQSFEFVEPSGLLERVKELNEAGFEFYQACGIASESSYEIIYSFDRKHESLNLKTVVAKECEVESISFVYPTAVVYEEEISENVGVVFRHISESCRKKFEDVISCVNYDKLISRRLAELAEVKDHKQMLYVMERLDSRGSFGVSLGYCKAVEGAMGIEVPKRAQYLRVILQELSRIQNHMMWLAELAERMSYSSLYINCIDVREKALDITERLIGGRIIYAGCRVGGMRQDISDEILNDAVLRLDEFMDKFIKVADIFLQDAVVRRNLSGLNIMKTKTADSMYAVGAWAKGSSVARDARLLSGDIYNEFGFEPVVMDGGDCMARCQVKIAEVKQSAAIIKTAVEQIPQGAVINEEAADMTDGFGEFASRTELSDGEVFVYVRGGSNGMLDKIIVRMPSYMNAFPLAYISGGKAGAGNEIF